MGLPLSLKSCLVLLLLFNVFTIIESSKPSKDEEEVLFGGKFPALYVLGDSLVDSGNNNHLKTMIKANFPPYGSDLEGGKPTGRFSNGKTIADYIAIYYGLPLVPAYLGLSDYQRNNISTGFNYASGGCGILSTKGNPLGCLSLSAQVDLFNETIKKKSKTQSNIRKHLGESLFMTAIGVNDYAFNYNNQTDVNEFANRLLHEFLVQIQRLYDLGARKFFINNIKPLGCYPNMIAHTMPRGSCNKQVNLAISIYNAKLRRSLSHMKHKLSFLYSDYFNFMLGLRGPSSNQASSNLLNTTSPCCPSLYDANSTPFCKKGSSSCKARDSYIFFDPSHPTQFANFMYAIECFQKRNVCYVVRDS